MSSHSSSIWFKYLSFPFLMALSYVHPVRTGTKFIGDTEVEDGDLLGHTTVEDVNLRHVKLETPAYVLKPGSDFFVIDSTIKKDDQVKYRLKFGATGLMITVDESVFKRVFTRKETEKSQKDKQDA